MTCCPFGGEAQIQLPGQAANKNPLSVGWALMKQSRRLWGLRTVDMQTSGPRGRMHAWLASFHSGSLQFCGQATGGLLYSHRHSTWRLAASTSVGIGTRLVASAAAGLRSTSTVHSWGSPVFKEATLVATPHHQQTRVDASQDGVVPRSNDCASGRQLTDRSSCSDKTILPPKVTSQKFPHLRDPQSPPAHQTLSASASL